MRPKLAESSNSAGCRFLPLITQKTFLTNTQPAIQTQPLSIISANCSRYPIPGIVPGQKRKRETMPLNEDGCNDVARISMARKRLQKWGVLCDSVYLTHHEFPVVNMGISQLREEHRHTSMTWRNNTLTQMSGQHRNTTTREAVKNTPIWMDKGDSWDLNELRNEQHMRALVGECDDHINGSRYQRKPFGRDAESKSRTPKVSPKLGFIVH
jgi:hypothetical protein